MEIFKNMGGNIPGGNFLGGNFSWGNSPGVNLISVNFTCGNFPGGSFPDTEENIYKEFSSAHALISIFIRKIFILQTHDLRV